MLSPRGPAVESEICARCAASGTSHEDADFAATSESARVAAARLRPVRSSAARQLFGDHGGGAARARRGQLGDVAARRAATLAASPGCASFVSTRRGAAVHRAGVRARRVGAGEGRRPAAVRPSTREPLRVRRRHGELWPCLVEKAPAKLHGSRRARRLVRPRAARTSPAACRACGRRASSAGPTSRRPSPPTRPRLYASSTAPPPESNALAFEIDAATCSRGCSPRAPELGAGGKRQLLLGCPWGGSGSGSGGGAAADAPSRPLPRVRRGVRAAERGGERTRSPRRRTPPSLRTGTLSAHGGFGRRTRRLLWLTPSAQATVACGLRAEPAGRRYAHRTGPQACRPRRPPPPSCVGARPPSRAARR